MLWHILRLINSINYGKESLHQWQLCLFAHRLAEDCLFFISAESSFPVDHFWVSLILFFKASLRAKSLLWMSGFIHNEIITNNHDNKKDSPWKRDWGERGNGLFIVQEISVTYRHCIVLCAISEILSLILRSVILARSFALSIVGHRWSLYHPIVWQILFRWWSYSKGVN